jgi:hypothetical protein
MNKKMVLSTDYPKDIYFCYGMKEASSSKDMDILVLV